MNMFSREFVEEMAFFCYTDMGDCISQSPIIYLDEMIASRGVGVSKCIDRMF